jgi:hypothetical protein
MEIYFNSGKRRYSVYNLATPIKVNGEYQIAEAGVTVERVGEYWENNFIENIQCDLKKQPHLKPFAGWHDN